MLSKKIQFPKFYQCLNVSFEETQKNWQVHVQRYLKVSFSDQFRKKNFYKLVLPAGSRRSTKLAILVSAQRHNFVLTIYIVNASYSIVSFLE